MKNIGNAVFEIEIASRDRRTLFMFVCACHSRSPKAPQTSASLYLYLDRGVEVPQHRAMEGHFACATLGLPGSGGNLGGLDGSWKGGRGHGSVLGPPGEVLDAPWSSKSIGIDSHIESLGIRLVPVPARSGAGPALYGWRF